MVLGIKLLKLRTISMKCKQIKLTQVNFHERLIFGAKYSRMDQVKFVEDSLYKI